ncbi:hypothetical protein APHAL10511_001460 [Amanita phalloides]|nr:hypothetical protein APHAL10511_001460 [Amanita phalloides]
MLLWTKFVPRDVAGIELIGNDDDQAAREDQGVDDGQGLQHLLNFDLFFVNDGTQAGRSMNRSCGRASLSLANLHSRLRKLRDAPTEDMVSGKEYEN